MMDETEDRAAEEPRASKPYLDAIARSEKAFHVWNDKCDTIDKLYSDLEKHAAVDGDREMQVFWANLEVLKPTIYTRAPQPVVMPRHRDGREVHRKAAEMLERVLAFDVEFDDLHETLLEVRDDLAVTARGVPWVLDDGACIHVDRIDFAHDTARKWKEVGWVARRAYLTREEFEARFPKADPRRVKFSEKRADDDEDGEKKAAIWEIWSRSENLVIWVTEGYDETLDVQPPLFDVKGFFPCPRPAYGTLQRRSLKPVPDMVYYRDQLDEINELTARISSLAESLRLKGFYASGQTDVATAIETAMAATDNKAILVPVSNAAALGGGALKDSIIWLPVREVAEVITALVQLRRQMIEDVYEITGLSDIMRGSTQASETATAQNLKAQYGSVRVRERQSEMARIARDVLRIKAEVFAETYDIRELAEMAQMEIPAQADIEAQVAQMMAQAQQVGEEPQQPDLSKVVTLEAIDELLKSQRTRPFVLEVESDSTIAPNEEAEKASRTEFITAVGGFLSQAGPMVQQMPATAPFAAELLKFTAGGFRAGRELGAAIDEFSETIKGMAGQGQQEGPSPEQIAEAEKAQAEGQKIQAELQKLQAGMQADMQRLQADLAKTGAEIEKIRAETARIIAQTGQPLGQA